jgi:hypothetical protein
VLEKDRIHQEKVILTVKKLHRITKIQILFIQRRSSDSCSGFSPKSHRASNLCQLHHFLLTLLRTFDWTNLHLKLLLRIMHSLKDLRHFLFLLKKYQSLIIYNHWKRNSFPFSYLREIEIVLLDLYFWYQVLLNMTFSNCFQIDRCQY